MSIQEYEAQGMQAEGAQGQLGAEVNAPGQPRAFARLFAGLHDCSVCTARTPCSKTDHLACSHLACACATHLHNCIQNAFMMGRSACPVRGCSHCLKPDEIEKVLPSGTRLAVPQEGPVLCPVCRENIAKNGLFHEGVCYHGMCRRCIAGHIVAQSEHYPLYCIPCPRVGCGHRMNVHDVRRVREFLPADLYNGIERAFLGRCPFPQPGPPSACGQLPAAATIEEEEDSDSVIAEEDDEEPHGLRGVTDVVPMELHELSREGDLNATAGPQALSNPAAECGPFNPVAGYGPSNPAVGGYNPFNPADGYGPSNPAVGGYGHSNLAAWGCGPFSPAAGYSPPNLAAWGYGHSNPAAWGCGLFNPAAWYGYVNAAAWGYGPFPPAAGGYGPFAPTAGWYGPFNPPSCPRCRMHFEGGYQREHAPTCRLVTAALGF